MNPAFAAVCCALLVLPIILSACASSGPGVGPWPATNMEGSPLRDASVMAFAVISESPKVRVFYEQTLGLRVLEDDAMALVLASRGTVIRLQKSSTHQPRPGTVLGWTVTDIASTVQRLRVAGVEPERFTWMSQQDQRGIATFPNGDQVAWFKDPDGNTLGLAQLVRGAD